MDKLLDSMSFSDDLTVTLLPEGPVVGLEKTAAAQEILDFTKSIDRKEGKFYLHINAMGAGEYYGSNRNGDYFPEDNLKQWHKTFETSPAHIYRHHINKDPSIAIGDVIFSYYNDRMHRVEIIAELDKAKAAPEYAAIERGEYPMTSMACNTPYDVCSICNNKAHTRSEYCSHLATQLNKTLPDGRRVMSLNVGPLKFFDMSIVIRPADVTSSVLQKVASANEIPVLGSVESAQLSGINHGVEKKASIKKTAVEKVADIVKEIPGDVVSANDSLDLIMSKISDPDNKILSTVKGYPIEDVIKTFAFLGINPSLEFLIKIIAGKHVGEREDEIASAAMEALRVYGVDAIPADSKDLIPDINDVEPNHYLAKELIRYQSDCSYQKEFVEKRASHDGYANWQVGRKPIEPSRFFKEVKTSTSESLLRLAGAAIIAKIMISTIVGMQKAAGLTIGVEKSAGLTEKLMDLSVRRELRGIGNV